MRLKLSKKREPFFWFKEFENKKEEANQLIQELVHNNTTLSNKQMQRSEENFGIMMKYLKKMSDAGIPIRIATDAKFGGKVLLTELKILSDYGFSTPHLPSHRPPRASPSSNPVLIPVETKKASHFCEAFL